MIASRFRSVVSAVAVAGAALGFYLVSLNVAAERNELLKVERKIASAKNELRYLQTEFGTRSRLSELERWNTDVLALQAAKPKQYVQGSVQLASLVDRPALPKAVAPAVGTPASNESAGVQLASYEKTAPAPAAVRPAPQPAVVLVSAQPAEPMLRPATYIKPAASVIAPAPEKVAMQKVALQKAAVEKPALEKASLLGTDVLGDIKRAAKLEKAKTGR